MAHIPARELAERVALRAECFARLCRERFVRHSKRLRLAAPIVADRRLRLPAVGRHDVGERLRQRRER